MSTADVVLMVLINRKRPLKSHKYYEFENKFFPLNESKSLITFKSISKIMCTFEVENLIRNEKFPFLSSGLKSNFRMKKLFLKAEKQGRQQQKWDSPKKFRFFK